MKINLDRINRIDRMFSPATKITDKTASRFYKGGSAVAYQEVSTNSYLFEIWCLEFGILLLF